MKQNQVIAVENNTRNKTMEVFNTLHHLSDKPEVYAGFHREYAPINDKEEKFPAENKIVQYRVKEVLKVVESKMADLYDIVATKDKGNTEAKADVVVDGKVLFEAVPAPTLLFLEKQLGTEIGPFIERLPELSESEVWDWDDNSRVYRATANETHRTKKKNVPLVLYEATDKFPAQTQLVVEDVTVGHWKTELISGGISKADKFTILERIATLRRAITVAREQANLQEVNPQLIGQKLFNYVFNDVR